MKRITALTLILIAAFTVCLPAQEEAEETLYEVVPGTEGNKIILSLSNISEITGAENVRVNLAGEYPYLSFDKESLVFEKIDPANEAEAAFTFDIARETPVNRKDTVRFTVTGKQGISEIKQFVISYAVPDEFKLEQNFPNPFNPATTIQYQLPVESRVMLKVYDILGREVVTLVNERQEAGYKEIKFNGSRFSSGVYIYRLVTDNYISTKKMLMVK